MRNFYFITLSTLILLLVYGNAWAQKLNLVELHNMSSNKNWETSNKYLLSKGWDYNNSRKGDDEKYNTITWAFNKTGYDKEKAQAWLSIYTYENMPNKVSYRFREKEFYNNIRQQLKISKYLLVEEEVLDESVVAKYRNANYNLTLRYNRESDEDYSYEGAYTVYEIMITQKGGIYDPDNGKKKEYDDEGNLSAEYSLKDGNIEGLVKIYNSNGSVKTVKTMKAGLETGPATYYIYDEKSGDLMGTYRGLLVAGNQHGLWNATALIDNEEHNIGITNFANGLKEGSFKQVVGDTVIYGKYRNDKLEGKYTIYRDVAKMLLGGAAETDSTKIAKIGEGYYQSDKLTNVWKEYDFSGTLISTGKYADSLKTGIWKYYYAKTVDKDHQPLAYSGKLFLEENYLNGKRNGVAVRYSYFEDEEVSCADDPTKTCTKKTFTPIFEKSYYRDDELNGEYELKNNQNEILAQGQYTNGEQEGKWLTRNYSPVIKWKGASNEIGYYVNGERQGKWERFNDENQLVETTNYNKGLIDGEHVFYVNNQASEKRTFAHDQLTGLKVLDKAENPVTEYNITDVTDTKFRCTKTERTPNGIVLQSYSADKKAVGYLNPFTFKIDFESLDGNAKILDGLYQNKTLDGNLLEEGSFVNNTKTGTWVYNYYDQKVKLECEYDGYGNTTKETYFDLKKQEPFSGEFVYKGDTVTEERKIKNGLRNGTTRYRDANDKTIKKESYKEGLLNE